MVFVRLGFAVCIAGSFLASAGFSAEAPEVLAQQELGKNACAPCAFLNNIEQANDAVSLHYLKGQTPVEKARDFAVRFGSRESVIYGKHRTAYSDENGTSDSDLLDMINRMRAEQNLPELTGEYLTRTKEETPTAYIQRVQRLMQGSIKAGFPPLLSVRSVRAQDVWNTIAGHWVCVVGASGTDTDEPLLRLKMADSLSGKMLEGLLYPEPRPAKVPMQFTVDAAGKEVWQGEDSSNCLFVSAPSLVLGTDQANWNERTYIAALYLIYRAVPGNAG